MQNDMGISRTHIWILRKHEVFWDARTLIDQILGVIEIQCHKQINILFKQSFE